MTYMVVKLRDLFAESFLFIPYEHLDSAMILDLGVLYIRNNNWTNRRINSNGVQSSCAVYLIL